MYKTYGKRLHMSGRHMRKALLIMRLSAVILFAAVMNVSATGFAQKVTLSEKNASLRNVLTELRKQSHFDFIYTDALLQKANAVNLNVKVMDLREVLDQIFRYQPLTYTIDDQTVIIKEREVFDRIEGIEKPATDTLMKFVVGTVTDANGTPLSGATVISKRTKLGTTTDVRGYFQLKGIAEHDTLLVSFIGYHQKKVAVASNPFMMIKLEEATSGLDEVVVQAYGQTSQRLATGDIGKVTAAEIEKQPVHDPLLALEGRVAGVVVTPQSGYEGGVVKVEIRGRTSINAGLSSEPLYIINGVPLTVLDVNGPFQSQNSSTFLSRGLDQTGMSYSIGQSPLYSINPMDIESIEVLKDADATAIYGSRGANGVVLITTKRGKVGPNQLNISATEGLNFNTRGWPLLKTPEYLQMRREAFRNDGVLPTIKTAPDLLLWDTTRYTDWPHMAYGGIGKNTDLQASLSGGTEQTTFRLGVGYNRTTDISRAAGADQRLTAAINLTNFSANKKLMTSLDISYAYSEINQIDISGIQNLPPDAPAPYDSTGKLNYYQWDQAGLTLPFSELLKPYTSKVNALNASLNISYTFFKGLKASVMAGYNNNQNYQTLVTPIASQDPYSVPPPTGSAQFGNSKANNWLVEPQLTYNRLISKGKFDFLVGGTLQDASTDGSTTTGTGYTSDIFIHSISLAPKITASDNYSQYKYSGVFGRITYNWEDKYIIDFNGRRDGSSRFAPGKQFGNFGAIGAAWILIDEPWVRKALPEFVSFLKLRGSYGTTGSDAVGDYQFLSQWGNSANYTPYGGVVTLLPQLQPNDQYHWQVNKKLEGGLNIEVLDGRIGLSASYYQNRCNNQLVGFPLPQFLGFTSVTANSPADVQNSGLEFTLNTRIVSGKNFSWMTMFNIGVNHNKLLAYPGLASSPYKNDYFVGRSLDLAYFLHFTGVDPLTGSYSYADHNHDGKYTILDQNPPGTNGDDRYVAINREPAFSGGFSTSLNYKCLSFSSTFTFSKQYGYNLLSGSGAGANGPAGNIGNKGKFVYENSWHYVGQTDAKLGRVTNNSIFNAYINSSDQGYSDASYVRWQNIALSVRLPQSMLKKAGLRGLSLNVTTYNILVFSKFKGQDPEIITYDQLPPSRKITAGLTCNF